MVKTPAPLPWMLLGMFAGGYLLSTLLRGVTAALAPYFTQEFSISPAELGLLAGSYFLALPYYNYLSACYLTAMGYGWF